MDWKKIYTEKLRLPQDAVKAVKSGDRVYVGTASTVAYTLCDHLYDRKEELEEVMICLGLMPKILPFFQPEAKGHFRTLSYFCGAGERVGLRNGQTEYTSIHLSEIRTWIWNIARPNVAFLEVSEPDENGYMSYGAFGATFHDIIREMADLVILQVNKNTPYVYGESNLVHVSDATFIVEADDALAEVPNLPVDESLSTLSQNIVDLIPDGACLQLGLGGISNAVGYGLKNKNDIGVHTEMFTDSMMDLMKLGVINNKAKNYMPGKAVTAFTFGTRALYDYVDHNENLYFAPFHIVNNPYNIAQNDNMISVNTAMSVNLYGEVVADCLGGKQQSATGGQVDYVRGAQMSKGGKSFIALTSSLTNKAGKTSSRIVADFPRGTAITTTRSDVQYIATEFGCINVKHLSMADRARALIQLAHPDFRDELTEDAKRLGLFVSYQ